MRLCPSSGRQAHLRPLNACLTSFRDAVLVVVFAAPEGMRATSLYLSPDHTYHPGDIELLDHMPRETDEQTVTVTSTRLPGDAELRASTA